MILLCNKEKKKTAFQLDYNEAVYVNVDLVNESGEVMSDMIKGKTLHVDGLEKGTCFLRLYTETADYITRKIAIE
jgi:hypothetical protein